MNVHCSIICNSQKREQSKYLSIDEWINKMRYGHIMEYYSAKKMNDMVEPLKHMPDINSYIVYDSIYKSSNE
jgi:hypothetical protein